MDFTGLIAANAKRWQAMRVSYAHLGALDHIARRLVDAPAKAIYLSLQKKTGVPWFVIAAIHEREASQSWHCSIAQGDPWNEKSHNEPAGRGPFPDFETAAVDALVNCAPYAGRWKDWSAGGTLALLEQYNGIGYARMGRPSPYIWSWSDQYVSGKYIRDHVYDPNAVDSQCGCAPLLARMAMIDQDVKFDAMPNLADVALLPTVPTAPTQPVITHPTPVHQPARIGMTPQSYIDPNRFNAIA